MGVLNRELFEQSKDAYGQAALDLVMESGTGRLPPIPQVAKDESLALLTRAADQKMLTKYGDRLGEAFGVAYRFATAETWEDLNLDRSRALMDEGLERVRQQHIDTGEDDPLVVSAPLHRVHYPMLGLVGQHPAFEEFRDYIFSRGAYHRLESLDDLHLRIGLASGGVKGRHAERFMEAQVLAWRIGQALGVLDVLGEVPN